MKPEKKSNSPEKPRLGSSQLCSDSGCETSSDDIRPPNEPNVALPRPLVTAAASVRSVQNQGPRSNRVEANVLLVQNQGTRSCRVEADVPSVQNQFHRSGRVDVSVPSAQNQDPISGRVEANVSSVQNQDPRSDIVKPNLPLVQSQGPRSDIVKPNTPSVQSQGSRSDGVEANEPSVGNQGPISDRVEINGLGQTQSVFNQNTSDLGNILARLGVNDPPRYQSMNFNPPTARVNSVAQPFNNSINSMNQNVVTVLTIRQRRRSVRNRNLTPSQEQKELDRCRNAYDQEYLNTTDLSLSKRLELATKVLSASFTLEGKYKVLNIWRIIEQNKEKHKFLRLTQVFGILEKYASNLIKSERPPYWRSVKFTSNPLQVHLFSVDGSLDVLKVMGYTYERPDSLSFPGDVLEPDVEKLKKLAADLFLAKFELDTLYMNKHPHFEVYPPIASSETKLSALFGSNVVAGIQLSNVPQPPARPNDVTLQRPLNAEAPLVTGRKMQASALPPATGVSDANVPFRLTQDALLIEREPVRTSSQLVTNSQSQQQRLAFTTKESHSLSVVHPPFLTSTNGNAAMLETTDSPSTRFQIESHIQSIPPGGVLRETQSEHLHSSTIAQSESDDSEYEDAQDELPSTADITDPMTSDQGCAKSSGDIECNLCGEPANTFCDKCTFGFCSPCDIVYHKHKMRQNHKRRNIKKESQVQPMFHSTNKQPCYMTSAVVKQSSTPTRAKKPVPTPRQRPSSEVGAANMKSLSTAQTLTTKTTSEPPPLNQISSTISSEQNLQASSATVVASAASPSFSQTKGATQGETTSSTGKKDKKRPILRPPPFKMNLEGSVAAKEADKDLNKRDTKSFEVREKEKVVPVKVPEKNHPISSKDKPQETSSVLKSCQNCFCLNTSHATSCIVCGYELTLTQKEQKPLFIAPNENTRPFLNMNAYSGASKEAKRSSLDLTQACKSEKITSQRDVTSTNISSNSTNTQPYLQNMSNTKDTSAALLNKTSSDQTFEEWSCEWCTLLNPASTTVCEMCFKTRSKSAKTITRTSTEKDLARQAPTLNTSNTTSAYLPEMHKYHSPGPVTDFSKITTFEQLVRQGMFADPDRFLFNELNDQYSRTSNSSTVFMHTKEPTRIEPPSVAFHEPPTDCFPSSSSIPDKEEKPSQADIRRMEEIYIGGLQFVEWMREAERTGFTPEELSIATNLGYGEPRGPIYWLKTKWYDLIQEVLIEMTKTSPDLGNISPEEARTALVDCTGDVQEAAKKCANDRKKKLNNVMQKGVFTRADCVSALDNHDGHVEEAVLELQRKAFEPMLERIKDSCLPDDEGGVFQHPEIMRQSSEEQQIFEAVVSNKEIELDRRIRMLFVEKSLQSWGRAETAVKLIDRGFAVEDAVEAARQCGDLSRSLRYLQQECPLCIETKPMNQMITFLNCQDKFCKDCVRRYLEHTINDKNIKFLTCPTCGEPKNLDDDSVATDYFNNMDIIIKNLTDSRVHDLYQKKVRDRTLMKEPNFRWCSHCSSGFINENPLQIQMQCPHCGKFTCFRCKKQWEDQHEGITCEEFAAWKEANDPERQAAGLAAHLRKNGIECPDCKFRYDLSKGGCMHFRCAMCSHEFCSGCYSPFKHGAICPVSEDCAGRGLHAHHPRDCLFYMRDYDIEQLEKLLRDNNVNVEFNTEQHQRPGEEEEEGQEIDDEPLQGAIAGAGDGHCKVMEQKEGEDGLFDAHCGGDAPPGFGGLCRLHYKEYLVELINDSLIDPAELMKTDDLKIVLIREYIAVPEQNERETDEEYQLILLRTLRENIPLPEKPPRKRVLDNDQEQPQIEVQDLEEINLAEEEFNLFNLAHGDEEE